MADAVLEKARDLFEGQIVSTPPPGDGHAGLMAASQDFEGQRLAELITTVVLTLTGIAAFLVGYVTQDIYQTLRIGLGGTALTFLLVVPPWPFFNSHSVNWLPPRGSVAGFDIEVDGKKVS
ncbi:microsomal signal peptidase 12 kDa subunit-domain-containing protein [Lineolata rhizophorae]|uniref:Signal peptidase complex subunit 1 n=1 Tax=Lineolata rhizophorae TaxID=578093 RepID=A0A6A6P106_9PEZI|nr:microsomal signal peptidase 12 kDa subunit-domain-containing protein [Lineolata rhizophorae]